VREVQQDTFPRRAVAATDDGVAARRAPRGQIALDCSLRRRVGSPIAAQTIELGPEGMRVISRRPLADDETVDFDLPGLTMRVAGHARVLSQPGPHTYVLRFERLPEPMWRCLHALAVNAG